MKISLQRFFFVAFLTVWLVELVSASSEESSSLKSVDVSNVLNAGHQLEFFANLTSRQWVKIHEQHIDDDVYFKRQEHAGSAFDSKRGHLILFGSDTHVSNDWTNSPLLFDTHQILWKRLYESDASDTYRVNDSGFPVAGRLDNHPWAMHTFGAVEYDSARDQLVVSSMPRHMVPGRFTDVLSNVWYQIENHPTWEFDLSTHIWRALDSGGVHFFPYATAYDADRKLVVGYRDSGVYEFSGSPPHWRHVIQGGLLGYHNNAVYDDANKAIVVFGSNGNSNDVVVYQAAGKTHRVMPTTGVRPPKDEHVPMAFHSRLGKTVVVVDRVPNGETWRDRSKTQAETWLYDLATDRWSEVLEAKLAFGAGMNYNLEYDPNHDVLLLVTSEPGKPTSVWALRL